LIFLLWPGKRCQAKKSAPTPCTGAVGYEESEKTADQQTFNNLLCMDMFHLPSFSEIEKKKSYYRTYKDSGECGFKSWRVHCTADPGSLWFDIKLFELHVCKYIDTKICKSKLLFSIAI
jgi:hypothetical protein